MKFAITGHQGLIGSSLKRRLEDDGHRCVLNMDLQSGDDICCDMPEDKFSADIVFHLAAQCKINKCIKDPELAFENVLGVHQILEFCRKNNIKKVVTFSSSRILSKERNTYTASKMYMEELCKSYATCYGIEYIIIRPSTVYGPFDDKTHRLIDMWVRAALNGNDLIIYGNPKTKTLDFTFVDDFVDGVMLILGKDEWDSEYNISGEEEANLKDLAAFIIMATESTSNIVAKEVEMQQPQKVNVDISKIKGIGYVPKMRLTEGILETIKFYKENNLR